MKKLQDYSTANMQRREWIRLIQNKKIISIAKYGNTPVPHDPTYKEAYNQAIEDVIAIIGEEQN